MHTIEPHYNWRNFYQSEEDINSPFFGRRYDEFYYQDKIYDHYLHPQWDEFGSQTLYIKILYANYEEGYCFIEMIGEWNDCLYNDIMFLKREVIDVLMEAGINKFTLIGENVLNFHTSDDSYYEEWFEEINDGWIMALNFRDFVMDDFVNASLDHYLIFGKEFHTIDWRTYNPQDLFQKINSYTTKLLIS